MEENQTQLEEVVEDTQPTDEQVEDIHTEVSEDNKEVVEEKTYTQEDIDSLQAQIDELSQYKPEELTEQEQQAQAERQELWQERVNLTLEKEGLEVFAEFIRADVGDKESLQSQINKLKEIVGALEISNGYQPTNHKPVDGFAIAKKNRDSIGMIKNKLNF
ncbi:xanthine phosphoribosyltransferase [Bacillus thuringiensis]|uniref:xanthine phosphoribosyltransferase n=1 Tax=Bacillus cereus group TaxID=86661 RepID=UPI000BF3D5C1|nr:MULTISPECIES: xanthine phosphoribosyltransferase [Bacillus cereus group]PEV02456.1 xanthine phosphoribosyltransferase [Bacillus thuringiensis]PEY13455.1 xanthine phosphoribosyltransferase [Bacillus cereus]PFC28770.1 xanthine phosphoribosyltransferase [Bacillus thuringiensis]PHF60754.1 xanthine phosphoribosyltransferase [Bacillus wiedmannii]PHF91534.1 xanthine phosphoribosyltransferase [Bacillus wiedmannii]